MKLKSTASGMSYEDAMAEIRQRAAGGQGSPAAVNMQLTAQMYGRECYATNITLDSGDADFRDGTGASRAQAGSDEEASGGEDGDAGASVAASARGGGGMPALQEHARLISER